MGHPRKLTGVPLRQPARPFRRHNSQTRDIEGLDLLAFRPPSGSRRTSSSLRSAKPKICRSPILYAARLGNFSKVAPWAQLPTSRRHTANAPRCLWIGPNEWEWQVGLATHDGKAADDPVLTG